MQKLLNLHKKNFINLLYIIFLGGVSSFSLPPYNYFIINFITFSLLFIFLFNKKKIDQNKSFFKYGWCFGFGYFLSSLYWVSISLTFDPSFKFLIPISIVLLPSFLALFYGLVTYLFAILYSKNLVSSFFIFSLLFGIIEFVRGFIFTGFPWNLIAFSFSKNIYFIQILSIIGTYSFNLICISLFTIPALFILRKSIKEIVVCLFFVLVSIGFLSFGILKNSQFNSLTKVKHDYTIRTLSPNIGIDKFYSEIDELKIIKELINLSEPNKSKPTIFIWPEGIIPDSYLEDIKIYEDLFSDNFSENHIIVMGINSLEYENDKKLIFNSMAFFDYKLNLIYHYKKVDLVPFGEFIPFEKILGNIGLKTITNNYQSFSRGSTRKPFNIKNNIFDLKLLSLICYEIIYSGKLSQDNDYDYIINISEDGWFGKSIGVKQHLDHGIFRSVESGKYIIRSTNNGISAIINPMGVIEKKIKLGSSGYIDFSQSKSTKPTSFSIYGNKVFLILILLYIFLIFSFNRFTDE